MAAKIKVLVAEDEQFLLKVYQAKLTAEGFEVIAAVNGTKAIELARSENPQIILLDIMMPGVDGFDVLKDLKADPEFKDLPIIVFSNLGQDDDVKKAKELGAVDYIVKADASIDDVVAKVNAHLK